MDNTQGASSCTGFPQIPKGPSQTQPNSPSAPKTPTPLPQHLTKPTPSLSGRGTPVDLSTAPESSKTLEVQKILSTQDPVKQLEDALLNPRKDTDLKTLKGLLEKMNSKSALSDKATPLQVCLEIRDPKIRNELVKICLERKLGDISSPYPQGTRTGVDKVLLLDDPELLKATKLSDSAFGKSTITIGPRIALHLLAKGNWGATSPHIQKALTAPNLLRRPGADLFIQKMVAIGGIVIDKLDDAMIKKISHAATSQRKLFHLLLDKRDNLEDWEHINGMDIYLPAPILYTALRESLGEVQNKEIKNLLENDILPTLKGLITNQIASIEADYYNNSSKARYHNFYKDLHKKTQKLKEGERILVHVGCKEHSTYLLIEKTGPDQVALTHYNTGEGIHNHPKQGSRYHTYRQYKNVPIQQLTQNHWDKLRKLTKQDSMEDVNKHLANVLAKGIKPTISTDTDPTDYELQQGHGSCGIQGLMAYLRHQVRAKIPGSEPEKHAAYTWLKAVMLTTFAEQYAPSADEKTQKALKEPVARQKGELELIAIAQSDELYTKALEQWRMVEWKEDSKQKKGMAQEQHTEPLSRYAQLRKLSMAYTEEMMQFKEVREKSSPDPLSKPLLQQKNVKYFETTKHLMKQPNNIARCSDRISRLLDYGYEKEVVKEILTPQQDFDEQVFFEVLEKLKEKNPSKIESLHRAFIEQGRHGELELIAIANSEERYTKTLGQWGKIEWKEETGKKEFIEQRYKKPLNRYTQLRKLSVAYKDEMMQFKELREKNSPDLLSKQLLQQENVEYFKTTRHLMKQSNDIERFSNRIFQLVECEYEKEVVEELLTPQHDPDQQVLFGVLKKLKAKNPSKIESLYQAFIKQGREGEVKALFAKFS